MKTRIFHIVILLLLFLYACTGERNNPVIARLQQIDAAICKHPESALKSLDSIAGSSFSRTEKAYFQLLTVMAQDENGQKITSDTSINQAVIVLSSVKNSNPQNYMRALIHQGIVKFKLGNSGKEAYEPVLEAVKMLEENKLDLCSQQKAFYYLGVMQDKNNNLSQAHDYFRQALSLAEITHDSTMIFNTSRDMYHNRMKMYDFLTAESLLASLQNFPARTEAQKRDVQQAEAIFYNSRKKYRNALATDYAILENDLKINNKGALPADYFRLSESYKYLNRPDSALKYAELAVKNISDSTYYLNYTYYMNVAEIAEKIKDWKKSAAAWEMVYRFLNKGMENNQKTQITELERKYNLAEAEKKAIGLRGANAYLQFLFLLTVFLLIVGVLIYRHRMELRRETEKSMQKENKILEQEKLLAEEKETKAALDKQIFERKLFEKQFVIPIYRQISQRNLDIKNFLLDMKSNPYISKNQQMLEKIEKEYKNYIAAVRINENQFLTDELFTTLTGIPQTQSLFFNESEKMMLAFLATGADNQQMATLLNTSPESIRVRKSKLRKKMQENNVFIPDSFTSDAE